MKRKRSTIVAGLAAAAVAALLAACGGSGAAGDGASSADAKPQSGGTITVGINPPCGIDKAQSSGCNFAVVEVVDNLTEQLPSDGSIVPWLATSWEVSSDNKTYTFKLKDGVTFSNGEKFDASVVKLNFDNVIDLGKQGKSFQAANYLSGYLGSEVIDPLTVKVSFDHAKAGLLQALAEKPLGIIAPETITTKTPEQRAAEGVIGSGPFVISEVVPNERIVLTKRADYNWSSPKNTHAGPAYLDKIVFQILPEASVRTGALISDQIQVASAVQTSDFEPLKSQGYSIEARASAGIVVTWVPNLADPILADPAVRQALQSALDRDEIHDTVYSEYAPAPTSILSKTHPNYEDLSSDLDYDSAGAASTLDKAGWKLGGDGIRAKDGTKLTLSFQTSSSADPALPVLIQQQLKKVGIDLQIQQLTAAQVTANTKSGNWQLLSTNLTLPDADVLVSYYDPAYSLYFKKAFDPELQSLLSKQTAELDPKKRADLVDQIQEIIVTKGYSFPITETSQILAAGPKVHDLGFQAPWWPAFVDTWIEH